MPHHLALRALVRWQLARTRLWDRLVDDETGEGVISAAIAVLVMAFLGAAMWVAFKAVFDTAGDRVTENVNNIGS